MLKEVFVAVHTDVENLKTSFSFLHVIRLEMRTPVMHVFAGLEAFTDRALLAS